MPRHRRVASSGKVKNLGGAVQFLSWSEGYFLTQAVYMYFVDLEKGFDHVPSGVLWGLLQEYRI